MDTRRRLPQNNEYYINVELYTQDGTASRKALNKHITNYNHINVALKQDMHVCLHLYDVYMRTNRDPYKTVHKGYIGQRPIESGFQHSSV